ncbi:MAG: TetR/AcrR family transcriptional regulator [Pseudomonadota bacterium]
MGQIDTPRDDTREQLLDAALRQFAERGFHGASIAQIAGELGLTKQALLYYFRRKEDLYREILRRIAQRMIKAMAQSEDPKVDPATQFEDMMLAIHQVVSDNPNDAAVLMRELLETQRRDAPPEEWYLKHFLDRIVGVLDQVDGLADLPFPQKFVCVYQILSAIQYFAASRQTLTRFYGDEEYQRIAAGYPDELRAQVRRLIECGNGC